MSILCVYNVQRTDLRRASGFDLSSPLTAMIISAHIFIITLYITDISMLMNEYVIVKIHYEHRTIILRARPIN